MNKLLAIFIFLNLTSVFALDSQAVNSIVENAIKSHQKTKDSGVSVSVFTKNQILLMKGFGLKDRESNLPVSAKTLFAIGSTTKAFTALDIKLLENDHQLNLNDKVQSILPSFRLSSEMLSRESTLEDLLSHRIGLPRHDFLWYYSPFSRSELFERLQYLDFPEGSDTKFRNTFQYNNLLIMTAGLVVEEKSKMSWEEFTRKNILNVLQMNSTFFGVPQILSMTDIATPYADEQRLEHKDLSQIGPAGSMYSNSEDMTKWIQSFMQKRWLGQDDFFKPRIPLIEGEQGSLDYAYGLAWMLNTMNKKYSWYFHGGNIDGFSTMVLFSKELDLGIVVMVNQDNSALPNDIVSDLIKAAIKEKNPIQDKSFSPNNLNISFYNPESSLLSIKPKDLNFETSETFQHPGYGDISIISKNGEIFAKYYRGEWKLTAYDKDGYNYADEHRVAFPFKIENDFVEVPFEPQVSNIHFAK